MENSDSKKLVSIIHRVLLTAFEDQRALLFVEWKFLQVHQAEERNFHPAKLVERFLELISWATDILFVVSSGGAGGCKSRISF